MRGLGSSKWLGKKKERLELVVTVVEEPRHLEGAYGTTTLYKLMTDAGDLVLWFASKAELQRGNRVRIRGTVKAHGEYGGQLETRLTRVKILEQLDENLGSSFDEMLKKEAPEIYERYEEEV